MSRLTPDATAEPVSRGQTLRHVRGQGNTHFICSADHEHDWQPHPVDPYSALCDDHTYIYIHTWYRVSPTKSCLKFTLYGMLLLNINTVVNTRFSLLYVLHCFWLVLVVVCTTMFLNVFDC